MWFRGGRIVFGDFIRYIIHNVFCSNLAGAPWTLYLYCLRFFVFKYCDVLICVILNLARHSRITPPKINVQQNAEPAERNSNVTIAYFACGPRLVQKNVEPVERNSNVPIAIFACGPRLVQKNFEPADAIPTLRFHILPAAHDLCKKTLNP